MKIKGVGAHEAAVKTIKGQYLVFQSALANPNGTEYIRFIDSTGKELLYYDSEEWKEQPIEVMGAIMGAICNGTNYKL